MGILRRLRQWREKADGTLSGPALETEEAHTDYQPNSGMSPWANPRMQSSRSLPVPSFERYDGNPLYTLDDLPNWSPVDLQELYVLTTESLSSPQSRIYLYQTSHDSTGMGLLYQDHPTDTPSVESGNPVDGGGGLEGKGFYHEQNDEIWMYRNDGNDSISKWTSPDGLSWTDNGVVLDAPLGHAGIPTPVRTRGDVGIHLLINAYAYQKGDRKAALTYSETGDDFSRPVKIEWESRFEPTGTGNAGNVSNALLITTAVPYRDGWLVFYNDRSVDDRSIRMGITHDGLTVSDLGTALSPSDSGAQSWEDGGVYSCEALWFNGSLWLFYHGGTSDGTGGDGVGVAKADFGNFRGGA